jgi:hypothetical protein
MGFFWIWGLLGLIGNLLSLNGEIGVAALSSQLLWIGGMLLFGLGALLLRPAVSAEDTRALPEGYHGRAMGIPYKIDLDGKVTALMAKGPQTYQTWHDFWKAINVPSV